MFCLYLDSVFDMSLQQIRYDSSTVCSTRTDCLLNVYEVPLSGSLVSPSLSNETKGGLLMNGN